MLLHLLLVHLPVMFFFFFFKQKTAYEMRISDWSSDVCSSDLGFHGVRPLDDGGALWRDGRQSGPHRQPGQAVVRKAAIASPSSGSVTLDIWVPGIVASRASGSAATRSSAEPLS